MTKPKAQQEKEAAASKRGRGRPSPYTKDHVKQARFMASLGASEIQIAQAFSIHVTTLRDWRRRYPEFSQALEISVDEQIAALTGSLFHRGMGYSHKAEKIMTRSIGGGMSEVVREEYVEHYPPDVSAIQFFLKNRDPSNWKDRQEVQQTGDLVVRVEGGLPDKEPDK